MPQRVFGRLGVYLVALVVILIVGSCGTAIAYSFITEPDAVRVYNDTNRTVIVYGCNFTIGWNGQRELRRKASHYPPESGLWCARRWSICGVSRNPT